MEIFTVTFFGHRYFNNHRACEERLKQIFIDLLRNENYVEFLVGRNGEFDQFVSSSIRYVKREYRADNSAHVLVLPYMTAEYRRNKKYFEKYYDEIMVFEDSCTAHYKAAIQTRNRGMVDRADLVICYVEAESGGAYQTMCYAEKSGKKIINLAEGKDIVNLH